MRPSIPKIWLDLLIVPKHDDVKRAKNVIETEGPLTLIEQAGPKHKDAGLILLGGDSSHYVWDNESLLSQIEEVTKRPMIIFAGPSQPLEEPRKKSKTY